MHLIVYTSEYSRPADELSADIAKILESARVRNAEAGITGVLFQQQNCFLQFIEGSEFEVRQLMQRITNDDRHRDIRILIDEPVQSRAFAEWNMDHFEVDREFHLPPELLSRIVVAYRHNLKTDARVLANVIRGFIADSANQPC